MEFDGIPFRPVQTRTYDRQHGDRYYKQMEKKSKQLCLQSTKKIGCPAHMVVKEYHLYPDYQLTEKERHSMKEPQIKALKKERHRKIVEGLNNPETPLQIEHRYFVSLPTNDAHEKVHPTGKAGGMSQRVHPIISQKIESLVKEGIIDVQEVKRHLRCYVKSEMKDHKPHESNRAYHPTNTDIRNHIDAAKAAIQFSKFDQVNLKAMVDEWSESKRAGRFFFRPFIKKESSPSSGEESSALSSSTATSSAGPNPAPASSQFTQELIWIHQEEWQQEILVKYGNTMTLVDATYKTTKYDLPLFFVTVRTNVGYKVAAYFIVQSESTEQILEALNILKQWNPDWKPAFFLCDYSEAEISSIQQAFPTTTVYLCDFHREQAWTRWVRDHKNGLNKQQQEQLLALLRACAWAPSAVDTSTLDVDAYYQQAVADLK